MATFRSQFEPVGSNIHRVLLADPAHCSILQKSLIKGMAHGVTRVEISHFEKLCDINDHWDRMIIINQMIISNVLNHELLKERILNSIPLTTMVKKMLLVAKVYAVRDSKNLKVIFSQGYTTHCYVGHSFKFKTKTQMFDLLRRFVPPNCQVELYRFSVTKDAK
jgi:hypothetical protein